MSVYLSTDAYVHVYVYIYIYTCDICRYIYIYIYVHSIDCTSVCVCVCACVHTYVYKQNGSDYKDHVSGIKIWIWCSMSRHMTERLYIRWDQSCIHGTASNHMTVPIRHIVSCSNFGTPFCIFTYLARISLRTVHILSKHCMRIYPNVCTRMRLNHSKRTYIDTYCVLIYIYI